MRQSRGTNKKLGYIMVPLLLEQKKGESEASALARSGFDEVAMVLAAMLENDEDLVDTIGEMQKARGRGVIFNPKPLHDKIKVIGPAIDLSELSKNIDVEILDRLGMTWDKWFGILMKFYDREGHSRVGVNQLEDGHKLGIWCSIQRMKRHKLQPDRLKMLNSIGYVWDLLDEQWADSFSALQKFYKREGHSNVVQGHIEDAINLGAWVSNQRKAKDLDPDKIEKLNSVNLRWDPVSEKKEKSLAALLKFHKREGHCDVPQKHWEDGVKLGTWVSTRRMHKAKLSPEVVRVLDSIGFTWNTFDGAWEKGFAMFKEFIEREGHSDIPKGHKEGGVTIGGWAIAQRMKKSGLSTDKISRLDSINFCWDPLKTQWEVSFKALKRFHLREKSFQIPSGHKEDGVVLSTWTVNQRSLFKKGRLLPDQIERLNSIGFPWDFHAEQWNHAFKALEAFKAREGHCIILALHKEGDVRLGAWIRYYRVNMNKLSPNQLERLNALDTKWHIDEKPSGQDAKISALIKFRDREGHFDVSSGHVEGGVDLCKWMKAIRTYNRKKITASNIALLDSRNFPWCETDRPVRILKTETIWEAGIRALVNFRKREGHYLIPKAHKEDDFPLGKWVSYQRKNKDKLSPERVDRLNELNLQWEHNSGIWAELFIALVNFHSREGHTLVPHSHDENGLMLGTWVGRQRRKKSSLTADQVNQLDSLGFVWSPYDVQWEEFFKLLLSFHKSAGNCLVPQRYKVGVVKLGQWVSNQRLMKRTGKLSTERTNRLNSIGFTWVA
jgi:hypothetical protein